MNTAQFMNLNLRTIEGMDIFEVLGISGSSQQREQFLTQLGDAIWNDVIQSHIEDMTDDQVAKVDAIITDQHLTDNQKYERLFTLFNEIVPNAEEMITESAKQVKIDFLRARIDGLQEFFKSNAPALQTVRMAADMFAQKRYYDSVKLLKSVPQA